MRKYIIYLSFFILTILIESCLSDSTGLETYYAEESVLQVIGVVTDFDEKDVTTKSDHAVEVNEMTMFIFDSNGNIVGKPINVEGSMPTFVIDTNGDSEKGILGSAAEYDQVEYIKDETTMSECSIYIVANAWHTLEDKSITTLGALQETIIPVETAKIPSTGIPMLGTHDESVKFDLCVASNNTNTIATIPLIKLYSKVNVNIQVQSTQIDEIPSFKLTGWKLYNIPSGVRIGTYTDETSEYITDYLYTSEPYSSAEISDGNSQIYDISSQPSSFVQFTFYIPEHRATPAKNEENYEYPTGISENEKQKYKPQMLGEEDIATYVEFEGVFKTHQGVEKNMKYRIFLGQDNVDDFEIIRNQELNNIVSIKGATKTTGFTDKDNRDDSGNGNISVDYRVDSELTGDTHFAYYIERERLLDSHVEVRPLVIEFAKGTTGSVKIELTNRKVTADKSGEKETWIGVQSDRQDYFIPSLTADDSSASLVIPAPSEGTGGMVTVWLYFDDNLSIYDREGSFTLTYCTDSEGYVTTSEIHTVDVYQYGLIEVEIFEEHCTLTINEGKYWWSADETITVPYIGDLTGGTHAHYLYIERFEEYLNYFDPLDDPNIDMKYNGLEWGAKGVNIGNSAYNNYIEGDTYTELVITKTYEITDAKLIPAKLHEKPLNAAAYCYLKNKRTDTVTDGIYEMPDYEMPDDGIWYLPGIRELEQILATQFTHFNEFQNYFYWSSACGKTSSWLGDSESTDYARASKAYLYTVPLGSQNYEGETFFQYYSSSSDNPFSDHSGEGGYALRDELLRIRAAYKKSDGSQISE